MTKLQRRIVAASKYKIDPAGNVQALHNANARIMEFAFSFLR